jgi:hypothetical protein
MKEKIFADSKLLNKAGFHSTAAIAYNISVEKINNKVFTSGEINISDCSRTINLDLDCSKEKELQNALFKVQTLINTFKSIKTNLKEAYKLYNKLKLKKDE